MNEFEVYNMLGTRLCSDMMYINHSGPFRIPILPALFLFQPITINTPKIDILSENVKIARILYVKATYPTVCYNAYFGILFVL